MCRDIDDRRQVSPSQLGATGRYQARATRFAVGYTRGLAQQSNGAALTLLGGTYAIHGTNTPNLIGGFVSHGCIRMYNQDIVDLFGRVAIGTPVVVTR